MLKKFLHWLFPEVRIAHAIVELPAEPLIEVSSVQRGCKVWQPQLGLYHTEVNLN